ncbi:MAG: peptidase U34 [Actinomycetia bacterium]|nr:peptidase U34 [Actinomycetes bacterium]
MCDTLVSLTDDGILFAKNSDRDPNESQVPEWHRRANHPPGSQLRCTWITIDQAEHTNAVLISRPWWIWGAEMGTNEHGVVIGNEAVFTRAGGLLRNGSEIERGLLGMDMLRLALERTATAHEAVECIVTLLERHGQGGPASHEHPGFSYDNSFIVADPNGAIVLETAGRSHATEEVAGRGRSISNGLTIDGFAQANADPLRSRVSACVQRRARTEASAAAANGVADMFAALRDHGTDGAGPRYSLVNGALSAPCAHAGGLLTSSQSTSSMVSDLRPSGRHWLTGTSAPCTSLFKPARVDEPVDLGPAPGNVFDQRSVWWRHELLHRSVMRNPDALLCRFSAERDSVEQRWLVEPPPSVDAFAAADNLEAGWTDLVGEAVAAKAAPETRPRQVARIWRRWNRASALPA